MTGPLLLASVAGAALVMAFSGLISLAVPRRGPGPDRTFAALMALGGTVGATASLIALTSGVSAGFAMPWPLPFGRLALRLDALGAMFLVPVFVIPALAAIFGTAYWSERDQAGRARSLRAFIGLLACGMAGVVLAQDAVLLLVAWEIMALSAYFAIATEDDKVEVREAAWVYLVSTHVGTLGLMAFVALWSATAGSFDLSPLSAGALPRATATWLFALGLLGFGIKAGVMPLHVWLPSAHANAPSHVSAILSGVMLKVGVYGILRVCWLLPPGPVWWSAGLIALGALSAVLGIAFALGQRDFKRLLAYSSIENVGIIVLGVGVATLGRATGSLGLAALGLAGALLHTWNHSLFKSLHFFVAGALLHACGTRRMSRLGGLLKRMPRTAALSLVACVAIAALPPLNGFVGEWILYRGIVGHLAVPGRGGVDPILAAALVALSTTGALALAAFLGLFGTVFLGEARSPATGRAHDPHAAMLAPMGGLAALCLAIGLFPRLVLVPIAAVVRLWLGDMAADVHVLGAVPGEFTVMSLVAAALVAGAAVGIGWLVMRARPTARADRGTWDCGYAAPSARMQYGDSSFSDFAIRLFSRLVVSRQSPAHANGLFPGPAAYQSRTPDLVLDRWVIPLLRGATQGVLWLRLMQQGRVQAYMLYIALGVALLLALG